MTDNTSCYTLGRGKLHVDGRYIGNTPVVRFAFVNGCYVLLFATDASTAENWDMFLAGPHTVGIEYRAENPVGPNRSFDLRGVLLSACEVDMKGDSWQQLHFRADLNEMDGKPIIDFLDGETL